MEREATIRVIDGEYFLFMDEDKWARFDAGLVVEEMEWVAEKLNEGGEFDGNAELRD